MGIDDGCVLVAAHDVGSGEMVAAADGITFALVGHIAIVAWVVMGVVVGTEAGKDRPGEVPRRGRTAQRVIR